MYWATRVRHCSGHFFLTYISFNPHKTCENGQFTHFTGKKIEAAREAECNTVTNSCFSFWFINTNVLFSWFSFRDAPRVPYMLLSVPETSVKMQVMLVSNLQWVGWLLCMQLGRMAPGEEFHKTACFCLLPDSLVQLKDLSLAVGLGTHHHYHHWFNYYWLLSTFYVPGTVPSSLRHSFMNTYSNTMRMLLLSSFYRRGINLPKVSLLVGSRDGLKPKSVWLQSPSS